MADLDNESNDFLEELYKRYCRLMRYIIHKLSGSDALTDEAIQETLIRLMKRTDLLKTLHPRALETYIVKTTKCATLLLLKEAQRRSYYELDVLEETELPSPETPETRYLEKEEIQELAGALSGLSKRDQDLLYFRYILDMPTAEIAKVMGIKRKSLPQYLMLAKRRALKLLEGGAESGR